MKTKKRDFEKLIFFLNKDCQRLVNQDVFLANLLKKIIEQANKHADQKNWELGLEYCISNLYYYEIMLDKKTIEKIHQLLTNYKRPEWITRGENRFDEIIRLRGFPNILLKQNIQ